MSKLTDRLNELQTILKDQTLIENAQLLAAKTVRALMDDRIFNDGMAVGQKIGSYDTKPIYVTRQDFNGARNGFKARGKNSNSTTFANGNPRKSMYVSEGYKGFKTLSGRNSDFVNLFQTGSLRLALDVGDSVKGGKSLGFTNQEKLELAEIFEKEKYKKIIFQPTIKEAETGTTEGLKAIRAKLNKKGNI